MTTMKQLFTVLVAAMFAATSFGALAQDKKGTEKKSGSSSMEKKSDKSKSSMDKKSGSMDKKAAKKSSKKSETK
jgi:Ni/Co efflux regulator RcnB